MVPTLTLMSTMGISTVLAMVGGIAGTAAGSPVPELGCTSTIACNHIFWTPR